MSFPAAEKQVDGYFRFRFFFFFFTLVTAFLTCEWILFVFMVNKRNHAISLSLPLIYILWRHTENNLCYSLRYSLWDNRAQPSTQALVTSIMGVHYIWWVRGHTEGSTDCTDYLFFQHLALYTAQWKFEAALEDCETYELYKDLWTFYGIHSISYGYALIIVIIIILLIMY